jgi:pimeloyl-ACP methyl ester carboxylesterase
VVGTRRLGGRSEPFTMQVSQSELKALTARLEAVSWPPDVPLGWEKGPDPIFLRGLVDYWVNQFDWREQERMINAQPQFIAAVDGIDVHFVHIRGRGPEPVPLLLSHGWPSSFLEFLPVLPLLVDPGRYGEDPDDAFDVVVPSLPGFGLTSGPSGRGLIREAPRVWARLMTDVLGYGRFAAHGTDIGAYVTNRLALDFPDVLLGAHVTQLAEPHLGPGSPPLTEEERSFLTERTFVHETSQAYAHVQRTTPVTVGYALHDSPLGLAAWIVDKWRAWSDCDGEVLRRFSMDQLITTVCWYWFTRTALSAAYAYADLALATAPVPGGRSLYPDAPPGGDGNPLPAGRRIEAAVGVLCGVGYHPPLSWAERAYADLRRFTRATRGGHFLATEEPELLARELRATFKPLRLRSRDSH